MLSTTKKTRGFTLVEVIASITVLAIISAVVFSLLGNTTDAYFAASTRTRLHTELSVALDRIYNEISQIPPDFDQAQIAPDITSLNAQRMTWLDSAGNACELELSGTNLSLASNGDSTAVLLKAVSSFQITAYDEENQALAGSLTGAACDAIRRVVVSIATEDRGVIEKLRTKVFIRSTRLGTS